MAPVATILAPGISTCTTASRAKAPPAEILVPKTRYCGIRLIGSKVLLAKELLVEFGAVSLRFRYHPIELTQGSVVTMAICENKPTDSPMNISDLRSKTLRS
jgi:hypothetical protein